MADKDMLRSLGTAVRRWRKASDLTLAQLAERAQIDPGFLAYIEGGKKAPSLQTLCKIACALDVSFHDLFKDAPIGFDDQRLKVDRHVRLLCTGASKKELDELLAALKVLRKPGVAKALLTLAKAA